MALQEVALALLDRFESLKDAGHFAPGFRQSPSTPAGWKCGVGIDGGNGLRVTMSSHGFSRIKCRTSATTPKSDDQRGGWSARMEIVEKTSRRPARGVCALRYRKVRLCGSCRNSWRKRGKHPIPRSSGTWGGWSSRCQRRGDEGDAR